MSHADTNVNERLAAVTAAGTSVWLDQISRGLIHRGDLASMVAAYSLRGLTSNPAIFEKAILGDDAYDAYDAQFAELVKEGADARAIYQAIAIRDVQDAADILATVYDESDGTDGFVSLEVDPDLAHDADQTIEQAREYWRRVDRPNLMIKIPGTDAGLGPIRTAISEGINVNVTLLFSVEAYTTVTEAFITGLEDRQAAGQSLDVQSVASFFVSRVDTEVDGRLEDLGHDELAGKAGLANARAAYQRFQEIFHGERFAALSAAGAPAQRPLWASTGTKNPAYPPTLYVDGLVGPQTVNTMPMATLKAAADQTEVDPSRPTVQIDPSEDLQRLADAGIDMQDVTRKLLDDGITAFVTPMQSLLAGLERKRDELA